MEYVAILKTAVGILAIIFLPGMLMSRFLSKTREVGEFLALSFIFGLTPQLLLYAGNSFLGVKINMVSTLASIGLMCFAAVILGRKTWNRTQ